MTRGRLITIEGIDGAGKTTLAAALLEALAGAASTWRCCASRAACAAAERMRELVKDPGLRDRRSCRGAAVRRGSGAARGGGDRAAPRRRRVGAAG